jgi:hypothetical protein
LDDVYCRELHDRSTRGGSLSADEWRHLNEWYAQMDAAEDALLNGNRENHAESVEPDIDGVLLRIQDVTHRVAALNKQNDALRSEIASLYRQLPVHVAVHPA